MGRPRTEGREVVLALPEGFARSDYLRDLRPDDLVQLVGRKTWTTVVSVDDEWYVTTQDGPASTKRIHQRSFIIDAARRQVSE